MSRPQQSPDFARAPCYPSCRTDYCYLCSRFMDAREPINRQFVIIDGSVVVKDGSCPMYEAVRPFAEADHA